MDTMDNMDTMYVMDGKIKLAVRTQVIQSANLRLSSVQLMG